MLEVCGIRLTCYASNRSITIAGWRANIIGDSGIRDSEISLLGFSSVRRDRKGIKSGGGVAILPFRVRNDINGGKNECFWVELIRAKCKPTLICCFYRAPDIDFTKFISNLERCMSSLDFDRCDLVILGDLNIDLGFYRSRLLNWMRAKCTNSA